MKIHQLRNATLLLTLADHCLLVDPMLSEPGSLPGFKVCGGERRANPLVPLPPEAALELEKATGVLVTHEHPDHLDKPAVQWIKARRLPVWACGVDVPNLRQKGLDARELVDGVLGMRVEVIPARHGRGVLGWVMGPVSGVYLAHPDEPSVYITGDAVLTENVLEAIGRLRPDVIIAPAGAANFGVGGDILFSVDELVTLIKRAQGEVVLNHLEALDHCPTTRADLIRRIEEAGLRQRVHIPGDGEQIRFERTNASEAAPPIVTPPRAPRLQKWVTAWFSGT